MNLADAAKALRSGVVVPLQRIARGDLSVTMALACQSEGAKVMLKTFDRQQTPSGRGWAAPAHDYGHPLLRANGDLRASGDCVLRGVTSGGFTVRFSFADAKAPWQHYGTSRGGRSHIPARQIIPDDGWADVWITALVTAAQSAADAWMRNNFRT